MFDVHAKVGDGLYFGGFGVIVAIGILKRVCPGVVIDIKNTTHDKFALVSFQGNPQLKEIEFSIAEKAVLFARNYEVHDVQWHSLTTFGTT